MTRTALIVGAGSGISASFARLLDGEGYEIALASRTPARVAALAAGLKATTTSATPPILKVSISSSSRSTASSQNSTCACSMPRRVRLGQSPMSTPIRRAPHSLPQPTGAFSFVRLPPNACCPTGPATFS